MDALSDFLIYLSGATLNLSTGASPASPASPIEPLSQNAKTILRKLWRFF